MRCAFPYNYTKNSISIKMQRKILTLCVQQHLPSSSGSLAAGVFESPRIPSMLWLLPRPSGASLSLSSGPSSLPVSPSDPLMLNLARSTRLMELTLGTVLLSHRPSFNRRSRISQLNIPGLSFLYCSILRSTSGVATRGLEPPMTPGLILPVSW